MGFLLWRKTALQLSLLGGGHSRVPPDHLEAWIFSGLASPQGPEAVKTRKKPFIYGFNTYENIPVNYLHEGHTRLFKQHQTAVLVQQLLVQEERK